MLTIKAKVWYKEAAVAKKLILATGLAVILSGAAFCAHPTAQLGPANTLRSQAQQDVQDRQTKETNKDKKREQDIRDDAERLVELSSELKADVEISNGRLLSPDMVRKADEAEKLAKKLKKKIKEAIGPGPSGQDQQRSSPVFCRPPL